MSRYFDVVFDLPADRTFTYAYGGDARCGPGFRVVAPFSGRMLTGYVIGELSGPPDVEFEIKELKRVIDPTPLFDAGHIELARWMGDMYLCSQGEALSGMLPGGREESSIPAIEEQDPEDFRPHDLSGEQAQAVDTICVSGEGMFYLYGITGSGKTEVFLRAAERTIAEGRQVLYLVPEISLTHQLIEEVSRRFHGRVAVIHSELTPSQKLVQWRKIQAGEADIVIGARSAVFAPLNDLGLIVIDEEHEGTYKSGSSPRYHARQVAMKRRSSSKARLVMGSATPSIEAYRLTRQGTFTELTLSARLSGGSVPSVRVIDMSRERSTISRPLVEAMRATKAAGRQTILFLNRRGFSYHFHCGTCGYEMKCRQCSVSLTYHKQRNRMICHYCGYNTAPIKVCPECGSLDTGYFGFGTEMIESDLEKLFPDMTVRRVDTDAVRKRGSLKEILDEFRSGAVDILLGTQMVAKGLNFPGVKLVGIVLADTALFLPDFRAQERTFGLIVQVSGRAGRYFPDGEVIIQTYRPDNAAIRFAAAGDVPGFYESELEARRSLGFPPFSRLFRVVIRSKDGPKCGAAAEALASIIAEGAGEETTVLGPAECPLSVISGNHRYQIILKTTAFSVTHAVLSGAIREFQKPSSVYLEIDVDPVNLL